MHTLESSSVRSSPDGRVLIYFPMLGTASHHKTQISQVAIAIAAEATSVIPMIVQSTGEARVVHA